MVKRERFGNIRTEYRGVMYASKAEAKYAAQLDVLLKAKKIRGWGRQHSVPLVVNGHKICTMIVDFWINHGSIPIEFVEIKGFETAVYKLKKKLFEALTGGKLTVIKSGDV